MPGAELCGAVLLLEQVVSWSSIFWSY